MTTEQLAGDIADACVRIDTEMPAFKEYHPGVGPYGEPQLVKQVAEFLNELPPYVGKAKSKRKP